MASTVGLVVAAAATLGLMTVASHRGRQITAIGDQPPPSAAPSREGPLFTRTTADGITIRSYLTSSGPCCNPSSPPPKLAGVFAGLSNRAAIGLVVGPAPSTDTSPSLSLGPLFPLGQNEGSPFSALVVGASPEVALVRMRFASGATDEMKPVQGVAVLAHSGIEGGGSVEAVDASGTVILRRSVPGGVGVSTTMPPLRSLFSRQTSEGVEVRVYETAFPAQGGGDPRSGLVGELSTADSVTFATASIPQDVTGPIAVVATGALAHPSQAVAWLAVRAEPEVAAIRARFSDGHTDQMTPVKGWALVAHPYLTTEVIVEALDSSGRTVGTVRAVPTSPTPGGQSGPAGNLPLPSPSPSG